MVEIDIETSEIIIRPLDVCPLNSSTDAVQPLHRVIRISGYMVIRFSGHPRLSGNNYMQQHPSDMNTAMKYRYLIILLPKHTCYCMPLPF